MTTQNLWDAAKAVLRGNFITIKSYLKKQEKHWIDNLTLHIKKLEKEEQKKTKTKTKTKLAEGKKWLKTRVEIIEKERKEMTVKINKTKSFFF